MKRITVCIALGLLFVPAASFAAGDEGGKQIVVVQAGVEVPPPPTIVIGIEATPPPPVVVAPVPAPQPVYVAPQPVYVAPQPVYVAPIEEEPSYARHMISAGVGAFICAFGATQWGSGSACISDEFLMLSIPVVYRYRINDYLAAGGGLMIHIFSIPEFGTLAGAEGMGSFRVYAVPDWLYFEANILFGYPMLFSFMPSVGLSIPLGPVSIVFENQVPLLFFGGVTGWWQPVLGIEFHI